MSTLRRHNLETIISTWNILGLDFKILFVNRLHEAFLQTQENVLYTDTYRKDYKGNWFMEKEFKPLDEKSPLFIHMDKMLYRFVIDFQVLDDIIKNKPC